MQCVWRVNTYLGFWCWPGRCFFLLLLLLPPRQKMYDGAHISLGSLAGLPPLHLLFHSLLGDHDIHVLCIFLHCLCVSGERIRLASSVAGAGLFPSSPRGNILGIKRDGGQWRPVDSRPCWNSCLCQDAVFCPQCFGPLEFLQWHAVVIGVELVPIMFVSLCFFVCLSSASYLQPLLLLPNTTSTINMLPLGEKKSGRSNT